MEAAIAEKAAIEKAAIEAAAAEKAVIENTAIENTVIGNTAIKDTAIERFPELETFVPEQLLSDFPMSESPVSGGLSAESVLQAPVPEMVVPDQTVTELMLTEPAELFVPEAVREPAADLYFMSEGEEHAVNNNKRILKLHQQGKSKVAIAKELGLGVGEVKLVIDLYNNQ